MAKMIWRTYEKLVMSVAVWRHLIIPIIEVEDDHGNVIECYVLGVFYTERL
jgi:hypothetical protein